jgi:hypothetical protein
VREFTFFADIKARRKPVVRLSLYYSKDYFGVKAVSKAEPVPLLLLSTPGLFFIFSTTFFLYCESKRVEIGKNE